MKDYFYGIYGVEFVYHGEWADPELIWHKKSFNYYDVENTFWEIWRNTTEYLTANLSTENAMNEAFSQWMKKNGKRVKEFLQYLMDNKIFYGGFTMLIFVYIMAAMISAVLLVGAVLIVFRAGEKELICKYDNADGEKH